MLNDLEILCVAPGVSGDEGGAAEAAEFLLSPLGEVTRTPLGSVLCRMKPARAGLPHVMLTAHLDSIGMMVTQITDKGFVKAAPCGGLDRRSLSGARVTVHATGEGRETLPGVILATPPHLSDGKSIPPKADRLVVDIGMGAEAARRKLNYGDRITLDGPLTPLLGDRVAAASLDDRAGCTAVIGAAKLLRESAAAEISVALVSQEEVGSAGAATAAYALAPDFAFAVDVSFGSTPDDRPEDCAEIGKGPMIGFAPILDRTLSRRLTETAQKHGIPYQTEIIGSRTGTDADFIAVSRGGVRTGLLSIPLRFMHTAGEIAALCDLEQTARLLAKTIEEGLS